MLRCGLMPRRRKPKSKRKQDAIRHNCGIAAWRRAAAEYLTKGAFVHLPMRGTPAHAAMKKRQKELIPIVNKEIAIMIEEEKKEEKKKKMINAQKRRDEVEWLAKKKSKENLDVRLAITPQDVTDINFNLQSKIQCKLQETEDELSSGMEEVSDDQSQTDSDTEEDNSMGGYNDDWV
jgi:hypothetical protein